MKEFQSHKVVLAAQISAVMLLARGGASLSFEEGAEIEVDDRWLLRHTPQGEEVSALIGGYLIEYPDGYRSWSPAEVFELGYTSTEGGGFKAPPVAGYNDQSGSALTIVNSFKEAEERVLRRLDEVASNAAPGTVDPRWYAIGRTHIEQGFMIRAGTPSVAPTSSRAS